MSAAAWLGVPVVLGLVVAGALLLGAFFETSAGERTAADVAGLVHHPVRTTAAHMPPAVRAALRRARRRHTRRRAGAHRGTR
ncbi:hypothetical protein ACFXAZ_38055 [Streptomyces sp. NPDC059477]|uniref:hypothetical protein n=1 Tax=Streptomyces sp. NPDC059477 TaxID=3346847 RepID=UPI0036CB9B3C